MNTSKYTNSLMTNYSELLDTIYHLESSSGMNKKAYRPNAVGALGGYQITPKTFLDLQQVHPKIWGKLDYRKVALDDDLARQAAADILYVKSDRLFNKGVMPSEDSLLAAYHSGEGNVINNRLGPQGRTYVQKGLTYLGELRRGRNANAR